MKLVKFFMVGDTVIDLNEPSRIYEVVTVQQKRKGVWITLKNVITQSTYSAYDQHFLSQENLAAYRKNHEVEIYG